MADVVRLLFYVAKLHRIIFLMKYFVRHTVDHLDKCESSVSIDKKHMPSVDI